MPAHSCIRTAPPAADRAKPRAKDWSSTTDEQKGWRVYTLIAYIGFVGSDGDAPPPTNQQLSQLMTTITCLLATVLALLTIPLVILWRLSLTPKQNAKRLRSRGLSYKAIGHQLHISPTTARRWVTA